MFIVVYVHTTRLFTAIRVLEIQYIYVYSNYIPRVLIIYRTNRIVYKHGVRIIMHERSIDIRRTIRARRIS